MEIIREQHVPAPPETTWQALNDTATLEACIPGAESVTQTSETEYQAVVNTKIGPVKARFNGRVALTNIDPPQGYTLSFEGQGGAAGFAKGHANVELIPDGDGTLIKYVAKAQVGGKLAQIGSRLVDASARKLADQFFQNLARHIGGGAPTDSDTTDEAQISGSEPLYAGGDARTRWLLLASGGVMVVLLLFFLLGVE